MPPKEPEAETKTEDDEVKEEVKTEGASAFMFVVFECFRVLQRVNSMLQCLAV